MIRRSRSTTQHRPQRTGESFHPACVINTGVLRSPFCDQHIVSRANNPIAESNTRATNRLERCRHTEHVIEQRGHPVATLDFSNRKVNTFSFKLAIRLAQRAQERHPSLFKPREIGGMMRHPRLVSLGVADTQSMGVGREGLGAGDGGGISLSLCHKP